MMVGNQGGENSRRYGGAMRVATDVGGTFTDLVYVDTDGVRQVKVDTTPPRFEMGVMNAIAPYAHEASNFEFFAHGSTVIINALLSRKGARVALVTTKGFRDVLEIGRGNRPDLFNFRFSKPAPFVPRHLRFEVSERCDHQGREVLPIDLGSLEPLAGALREEGIEAIAVCFLHSYVNPSHEQQAAARLRELCPGVAVVASHEICREWREYERTSTTVLCAYVTPVARTYLDRLSKSLEELRMGCVPFIMQSNGGIGTIHGTAANPIAMVESGPASGILGAVALGKQIGETNLIALDIGGTTAKCALIREGEARVSTDYRIEWSRTSPGYPIKTPVIELVEIGNGGGSIAWLDGAGTLHVGPESAGASPGPAAYGRGGTQPTTTDANLVLGRINPDLFLGGSQQPDMMAVEAAFAPFVERLGGTLEDVARGMIRIANGNMLNALRLVSLNRGFDPRDFSLIAFGGGGAMHAVALGEELRVRKVIIPIHASVFSAWGMLMTDLRRDFLRTAVQRFDPARATSIESQYRELEVEAREKCGAEGFPSDRLRLTRFADMRYRGQEHTVKIAMPPGSLDEGAVPQVRARFDAEHQREYTFQLPNDLELVNLHVVASAAIDKQPIPHRPVTGRTLDEARKPSRRVDFADQGCHLAAIYDGSRLEPGMTLRGPAVIEDSSSSLVVSPGRRVAMDPLGNLHVFIREDQ
jgi:N-methylhydantoinase A